MESLVLVLPSARKVASNPTTGGLCIGCWCNLYNISSSSNCRTKLVFAS
jgi:hypothetical protein